MLRASFFLGALALTTSASAKDACTLWSDGMPVGQVGASLYESPAGSDRVCPRSSLSLSERPYLLADAPNFYGHILLGTELAGSYAHTEKLELFGSLEVLRNDTVISAVSSSYTGLGDATLGARYVLVSDTYTAAALHGHLVLPTAIQLYDSASPFTLDLGGSVRHVLTDHLHLRGHLDLIATTHVGPGPTNLRIGFAPTVGLDWRAGKAFGLTADLANSFGYDALYDYTALGLGFRFAGGDRFGSELGVRLPLAGRERALAVAELSVGVRLGALPADD